MIIFWCILAYMDTKTAIMDALRTASHEAGIVAADIELEFPGDLAHGDYSANVAMRYAKGCGKNPRELAETIIENLPKIKGVEKVEIAGPGFINFYLTREFFRSTIERIHKEGDEWGNNRAFEGKRVSVEYTDANPFKELHIGHLVPNALGESIARLVMHSKGEVKRVTFQGDVGIHVAKALWGMQVLGLAKDGDVTAAELGQAYAKGATAFEEDEEAKRQITSLNKVIYERSDVAVNVLYDAGKKASIEYFETAYELLGSEFDRYFFESETGPIGQKIVEKHIGDVFEESEGAVIFRGENFGLHTRVFINKEGLPTYESKDIGLIHAKEDWWPSDTYITVTGSEQETYFNVVAKAAEQIDNTLAGKMVLIPNGMLKLSEGKMSSRTGDVIPAIKLVNDIAREVESRMQGEWEREDKERVARQIAVAAIRYAVLKSSVGKDIIFDVNKSISVEGDSGPYVQYTYARARAIEEKAAELGVDQEMLEDMEVTTLERLLMRFPEVVARSAKEYAPHHMVQYITELASEFNSWYAQEHILDGSNRAGHKVALASAVATTLKNGLHLVGIEAPERM